MVVRIILVGSLCFGLGVALGIEHGAHARNNCTDKYGGEKVGKSSGKESLAIIDRETLSDKLKYVSPELRKKEVNRKGKCNYPKGLKLSHSQIISGYQDNEWYYLNGYNSYCKKTIASV